MEVHGGVVGGSMWKDEGDSFRRVYPILLLLLFLISILCCCICDGVVAFVLIWLCLQFYRKLLLLFFFVFDLNVVVKIVEDKLLVVACYRELFFC